MASREDPSCPSFELLSESLADPEAYRTVRRHVDDCSKCQAVQARLTQIRAHARALPWSEPDAAESERREAKLIEAALFQQQARQRRGRRLALGLGVGLAAAAAFALFFAGVERGPRGESPVELAAGIPTRSMISAPNGAAFLHEVTKDGDEVVHLDSGTLIVEAPPFQGEHPLRILTPDAEIATAGGSMVVVVDGRTLQTVQVISGRADVRARGKEPVSITPGNRWASASAEPAAVPSAPPAPSSSPEPSLAAKALGEKALPRVEAASRPSPSPVAVEEAAEEASPSAAPTEPVPSAAAIVPAVERTAAERALSVGLELLAGGDTQGAAQRFLEAEASGAGTKTAEDASYFAGVAWGRSGQSDRAIESMSKFLERYPESSRRGATAAMLGWIYEERGDHALAKRQFELAVTDPSPRVQESARRGLETIARATAPP
ncbi:MAG: tetratricopeptide repeat protein [Myxococcota bacterium]